MSETTIERKTIQELFDDHKDENRFIIPPYQRPYKWTTKNMCDLLNDIEGAIIKAESFGKDGFKYRLGTIILHNSKNVVDGQQRLISLFIIRKFISDHIEKDSFTIEDYIGKEEDDFFNDISLYNIQQNYVFVKDYLNTKEDLIGKIVIAFKETLEVIVINIPEPDLSAAFQLFDSQNSRGKALNPHDLLKAYHLREMTSEPLEMRRAVINWESYKSSEIRDLFSVYLYRVLKWSQGESCKDFTANDIDFYKGISENTGYNYAHRVDNAMPFFLLNEPFICGGDFFKMVQHYLILLSDIKEYLNNNENDFENIKKALKDEETEGKGYKHTCHLFYAALLFYYDKFKNLDPLAVQKIFKWSFSLRLYRKSLSLDSVNKHALGDSGVFSEYVPLFRIIAKARLHTEVSSLALTYSGDPTNNKFKDIIFRV